MGLSRAKSWPCQLDVLVSLVLGPRLVLEPARVLDGDSIAVGGLGAEALLESSLGNTHAE